MPTASRLATLLAFAASTASADAAHVVVIKAKSGIVTRYLVGAPLGKPGAAGAVYEAQNDTTGQRVAVKIAAKTLLTKRLLQREAALLARLTGNPRFAAIHGIGTVEGEPGSIAMVMERVQGTPLASTPGIRANPSKAVRIAIKLLEGVVELNRLGRRHADLHPGNILIDHDQSESVRLIDLGAAQRLGRRYQWGGPAAYYAPEQTAKHASLGRSNADVYSIGNHLLGLLTGLEPSTKNLGKVANAQLRAVITRATDPDPATRFQTSEEMISALRPLQSYVD